MDQKWVPWIEYVMEEASLIMEYNILQKLVLNTYLLWKQKTKQSHITWLTKVNSTWIGNWMEKVKIIIFLQYGKTHVSPDVLMLEKGFLLIYMKETKGKRNRNI